MKAFIFASLVLFFLPGMGLAATQVVPCDSSPGSGQNVNGFGEGNQDPTCIESDQGQMDQTVEDNNTEGPVNGLDAGQSIPE